VPHLHDLGLAQVLEPAPAVDFATEDGSVLLEVKAGFAGFRELDSAVMQLALTCQRLRPARAILGVWSGKLSVAGIRERWLSLMSVLTAAVRERLQLVVASKDELLAIPHDDRGIGIARALRSAGEKLPPAARRPPRSHEVLKVLVLRWLRREPPIAIHDLQAVTGLSHPSVSVQLRALGPVIGRESNRSVTLREFPTQAWEELIALGPRVRQSHGFADRSGRPGSLGALVQRVRRQPWKHVAVGGVVAARNRWHTAIDLAGTPRLDLEVHAPHGPPDLEFIARLDPALQPARPEDVPVLVVHAVTRTEAMFASDEHGGPPWADPVEVLLDLADLRLGAQADELVRHLRARR